MKNKNISRLYLLIAFIILIGYHQNLRAKVFQMDICENQSFGNKKIVEGSPAFTSYKNLLKNLNLAEKHTKMGVAETAQNNIKNALRYASYVMKKEPEADLSVECNRLNALQGNLNKTQNAITDLSHSAFNVSFLLQNYPAYVEGMYENPNFAKQKKQITSMVNFERIKIEGILNGNSNLGKTNSGGIQLAMQLRNFDQVIQQGDIIKKLYGAIDEVNNVAAIDLAEQSKRVMTVVKGFNAVGGGNPQLQSVLDYAKKQLQKAEDEMASIYTGEFHKNNVNKIVFTKSKYIPGNENSVNINPVFKTGDPIYATIYLSGTIQDALSDQKNHIGTVSSLSVLDENGISLNGRFDKWEVENYTDQMVKVYKGTSASQTYYQFLMLPGKGSSIVEAVKNKDINPIHLARGSATQGPRKKKFTVTVSASGNRTGLKEIKGSFEIDFSTGDASSFYTSLDNRLIEEYIKENNVPSAYKKDATLEAQLLANMNAQGYQESYKRAIILSDWEVIKRIGEREYRRIRAAFTYKTPDGKCGYRGYTFKSFPTGSSWTKPQKFGGTDVEQRIICNKI